MSQELTDNTLSLPLFSKIDCLKDRSRMLQEARHFFDRRNIQEVDCPIVSRFATVDTHIDLIEGLYCGKEALFLHSSPEYGMKRLLASGVGDCYQLSHVFRDGECGIKHNPEFMMAEWYRLGFTLEEMIQETVDFMTLFLGNLSYKIISYRDLFLTYTGIDYLTASIEDLLHYLRQNNIIPSPSLANEGKDALLNLILGSFIEPKLGDNHLLVLAYYPSSQAALAQKRKQGEEEVAERFEVYYKGIELANGYHELTCGSEQRSRFIAANQERVHLGKRELPIDENFLKALEKGLPDCCGVAVGFDRLMMLRLGKSHIGDILAWAWNEA